MTTNQRWHVADASRQIRRHWDSEDEWVVFHEVSGDVHLLNEAAVRLLDRLTASPGSTEELVRQVGATKDQVEPALALLDRLGLLHPASS